MASSFFRPRAGCPLSGDAVVVVVGSLLGMVLVAVVVGAFGRGGTAVVEVVVAPPIS